jgi:Cu(I)/Ag(I) efflux system membrane fusion protein
MRRFVTLILVLAAACGAPEPTLRIDAGPFTIAAAFSPDPPKTGRNTIALEVRDADGKPVSGATIEAVAVMPPMGAMAEMRSTGETTERGDGRYDVALELTANGSWPLTLAIHAPDGREAHVELDYATSAPVRVAHADRGATAAPAGDDTAYYTCSMHPSVRSAVPGKCPICSMDLVPVKKDEVDSGVIRVDPARRQVVGVRTGRAERAPLTLDVRAVGRVTWDETRLHDVSLKYQGWIGEVFADFVGQRVQQGRPLFTVYAPALVSAQKELLESARRGGPLLGSARQRLRYWSLSDGQIDDLVRAGRTTEYVPILAPASGVVIEKNVVDGSAVESGERLYRLADPSRVWVEADVYEADVPLVAVGQPVTITFPYLPGETRSGTIAFVSPTLDPTTRTVRARIELDNADGTLRPDMFANVGLEIPLGESVIVPDGSVIRAGTRAVVFVDLGEGRLEPRHVVLGRKGREGWQILDGLIGDETVVTSGNFLVAAESRLKAGLDKW